MFETFKKSELPRDWVEDLSNYCRKIHIDFLASPFDEQAVEILEKVDVKYYKVASSEIDNFKLLKLILKTKKPIFLSTGMCEYDHISQAVRFLKQNNSGNLTLLLLFSLSYGI